MSETTSGKRFPGCGCVFNGAIRERACPIHAVDVDNRGKEISDLKRQLSDSIAREQEIERELEYLQRELWAARESSKLAFRDAAKFAEQVHQERAHAYALAGLLYNWQQEIPFIKARLSARGKNQSLGLVRLEENTDKVLTAYRKYKEPGE